MTELLGDKVEQLMRKIQVDKLAKLYEDKTGKDCGCKKRKQFLNKMHQQMQNMRDRILEQQHKNLKR